MASIQRGQQAIARVIGSTTLPKTPSYLARKISTVTHQQTPFTNPPPGILPERTTVPPASPARSVPTTPPTPQLTTPESSTESENEFWRSIPLWKDVSMEDFASWRWGVKNLVETSRNNNKLLEFLDSVLPDHVPRNKALGGLQSRDEFMGDVISGIRESSMSVRIMPYVLGRVNWKDPANDPIFRQFVPLRSAMVKDHPMLTLDSLHEQEDSPVDGIVHRYPDKALFLPVSVCPTYCIFCTRSYGIGPNTEEVTKHHFKLSLDRLEKSFAYIESQPGLHDIVVSGGDAFYLPPHILELIGERLISMKNIERFRFASKGLAVAPHRFLDNNDPWTDTLIRVSDKAKKAGKHMALHTHFNHPNEISWITEKASLRLLQSGVTVRNQTVLLRGVNDDAETMLDLIKRLAKMAIQPYYVYQCDMVPKVEHLRTPLQTILDIESQIQGTIAGFYMPKFVVDLPGGGGKRLASLRESYDRKTGVSTFTQPALTGKGKDGKVYEYYDPVDAQSSGPQ
ncbi:hypothetical protein M426DRAFT_14395 [Hypoxylon sp. CI-4A]|nr:hypothetical protein M426DRAFT_14395 [Hypoxylon sp. CI-4A]